jgi:hypothetical protein
MYLLFEFLTPYPDLPSFGIFLHVQIVLLKHSKYESTEFLSHEICHVWR